MSDARHVVLGTAGHIDHGKTSLVAALTGVDCDRLPEEKRRGITLVLGFAPMADPAGEVEVSFIDVPGHERFVKNMLAGVGGIDVALLVVAADESVMPQTREHVLLARQVNVPRLVVFLNKTDLVDDPELLELVELEVRELLSSYDFPGDDIPIIRGSALKALEGDAAWVEKIGELMDAVDSYIPEPERAVDGAFLMPIEDVFSISGRGTVVTGRVERGQLKPGEEVEIVGFGKRFKTVATSLEMFRKILDEGVAGDNIGILLRGVAKDEVYRGMVVSQPDSINPHHRFNAEVYVLKKEEGGRHTPFFNGYRPQFYFRTTDVTGACDLPEGVEMVMPGDSVNLEVELITKVALEKGSKFAIREGGLTVGAGVITDIME